MFWYRFQDIQGVDYIDTKLLEGTEHEHLLKELDAGLTLLTGPDQEQDEPAQKPVKTAQQSEKLAFNQWMWFLSSKLAWSQ